MVSVLGKRRRSTRPTQRRVRRRVVRRRARVPRPMRVPTTLSVVRKCYAGNIIPSTTLTSSFWSYVTPSLNSAGTMGGTTLGGLTNLSEYTALFDQFKCSAIKLSFKPRFVDINKSQYINTSDTLGDRPYVSYAIDPRGNATITGTYGQATYNAFCEVGNVRTKRGDKDFSIYWKPKMVEQFAGGNGYRYISPPYADIYNSGGDIAHRGVYIFFHHENFTGLVQAYDVYITYYLKFRGMR